MPRPFLANSTRRRLHPHRLWRVQQRWRDLLFAHWPVPAAEITALLPSALAVDTLEGSAWVGIVPFWMDRVRYRGLPMAPGALRLPELNLRTYVHDRRKNLPGVYCFSLDVASPLAATLGRLLSPLPCYWSKMQMEEEERGSFHLSSERQMSLRPARFGVRYRSLGRPAEHGLIEYLLTSRQTLYIPSRSGRFYQSQLQQTPRPLEEAEAVFTANDLPAAHGIALPETPPLLHYSREMIVAAWNFEPLAQKGKLRARMALPAPKPL